MGELLSVNLVSHSHNGNSMFVQLKRQHTDGGTPWGVAPILIPRILSRSAGGVAFLLSRSKARTLEGCARAKTCPSAAVRNIYKLDVTSRQKGNCRLNSIESPWKERASFGTIWLCIAPETSPRGTRPNLQWSPLADYRTIKRAKGVIKDGLPKPLWRLLRGGGRVLLSGGVCRLSGARLSVLHPSGAGEPK